MSSRLSSFWILIIFCTLVIWLVPKVLSGNLLPLFVVIGIASILLIRAMKSTWIGLVLGFLTVSVSIPYPILSKLSLGFICIALITLNCFSDDVLKKDVFSRVYSSSFESKLMVFVAFIIAMRFLYDKPFSVELGSRGGGAQAVYFLMGALAYFIILKTASQDWNVKRNYRVLIIILIISTIIDWTIARLIPFLEYGGEGGYLDLINGFFWGPIWFLSPLSLATILDNQEKRGSNWLSDNLQLIGIIGLTLFLAITTPFRSRIYFVIIMVIAVSYAYNRTKKMLLLLGIMVSSIILVVSTGFIKVQDQTIRSLSTILTTEDVQLVSTLGETGWSSDFRWTLFQTAWADIQMSPLIGRGFSFSKEELFNTFFAAEGILVGAAGSMQSLALSGVYHNSILQLAAFCGIPCALAFSIVIIVCLIKFLIYIKKRKHDDNYVLTVGMLGFFVPNIGQLLMNGSGHEFFIVCVLMGIMGGLMIKNELRV